METQTRSEQELVQAAQQGDAEAFATLYTQTYNELVGYLRKRFDLKKEDAEDAAQETFTRAWDKIRQTKPETYWKAWLYQIAKNHMIDQKRREQVVKIETNHIDHQIRNSDSQTSTDYKHPTDPDPTPEEVVLAKERQAAASEILHRGIITSQGPLRQQITNLYLRAAWSDLGNGKRRYVQRGEYLHIANKLGISPETVKTHISNFGRSVRHHTAPQVATDILEG